jgi:hypothetical protein
MHLCVFMCVCARAHASVLVHVLIFVVVGSLTLFLFACVCVSCLYISEARREGQTGSRWRGATTYTHHHTPAPVFKRECLQCPCVFLSLSLSLSLSLPLCDSCSVSERVQLIAHAAAGARGHVGCGKQGNSVMAATSPLMAATSPRPTGTEAPGTFPNELSGALIALGSSTVRGRGRAPCHTGNGLSVGGLRGDGEDGFNGNDATAT